MAGNIEGNFKNNCEYAQPKKKFGDCFAVLKRRDENLALMEFERANVFFGTLNVTLRSPDEPYVNPGIAGCYPSPGIPEICVVENSL